MELYLSDIIIITHIGRIGTRDILGPHRIHQWNKRGCHDDGRAHLSGSWSPFEALLRTIVGQQVSVAAATQAEPDDFSAPQ